VSTRTLAITGLAIALVLAAFVAPFASSSPDGLERVATDHGIHAAEEPAWGASPLPDYQTPGVAHEGLATGTAGIIGTLVVAVAAFGIGRLLQRRRPPVDG
jgi:cobalt/nickel transport protein